jgi:hypothetical protein
MHKFVISGADTLVAKNSPLLWEMTGCGLLYRYQGFGVACCLHFGDNQRRHTDFRGNLCVYLQGGQKTYDSVSGAMSSSEILVPV